MTGSILIIDDDEDLLQLLGYQLEEERFRVLAARDGV
jgi:DNA-binding response OmpR family regulator